MKIMAGTILTHIHNPCSTVFSRGRCGSSCRHPRSISGVHSGSGSASDSRGGKVVVVAGRSSCSSGSITIIIRMT